MKTSAYCERCRQPFERDIGQTWKRLCWPCWRLKNPDKARYRQAMPRPAPDPLRAKFREYLPLLIRLCHPDRHGNSKASNQVTQWLLDERRRGGEQ